MVPARPGLTNALGCLVADLRQDLVHTLNMPLEAADMCLVSGNAAGTAAARRGGQRRGAGRDRAKPGAARCRHAVSRTDASDPRHASADGCFTGRAAEPVRGGLFCPLPGAPARDRARAGQPADVGDRPAAAVSDAQPARGKRPGGDARGATIGERALYAGGRWQCAEVFDRLSCRSVRASADLLLCSRSMPRPSSSLALPPWSMRSAISEFGGAGVSDLDPLTLAVIQAALARSATKWISPSRARPSLP